MTVFTHSSGGFLAGKQVFPVDYEWDKSGKLLRACHSGDLHSVMECLSDPTVDVNCVGVVSLKEKKEEVLLKEEAAGLLVTEYEEFKTDVTPLFLAAHSGNVILVRKLLSVGAAVNQRVFRGYATTAAAREGHIDLLEILLKSGACQPACEEALLEASSHAQAKSTELLMNWDMIRPNVAAHALVLASCRGFTDVVASLIKCGVEANWVHRVLLRSAKPALHTNVDCAPLVAAIVCRQASVVRQLLQAGAKTDCKVKLGAWSWDSTTGEEFRVGAGLADTYTPAWCAVEYFELTGTILRLLLQHNPSIITSLYNGRTLLLHAVLCSNPQAVDVLLASGADPDFITRTKKAIHEFRPVHLAAKLGSAAIIKRLVSAGCNVDARTGCGDTALMVAVRNKQEECLRVLVSSGSDIGLVNSAGHSALSLAESNGWITCFQRAVLDVLRSGKMIVSSNLSIFSPLLFVARSGNAEALKVVIKQPKVNLDELDSNGLSALMITAIEGHVDSFRLLVFASADVKLHNSAGETAISIAELHYKRESFEKVMLEYALAQGSRTSGFHALHCAARCVDYDAVKKLLTERGRGDVNALDSEGYTPLMLAARGQHGLLCKLLIAHGADCRVANHRGETALLLARWSKTGDEDDAEEVILDELARRLVLGGERVRKHTKCGKGKPHEKDLKMVSDVGVLSWGTTGRRNIVCKTADVGVSEEFRKHRWQKGDAGEAGLFRVMTGKHREIHFVCGDGENAALWVRGIKLVTQEASKF